MPDPDDRTNHREADEPTRLQRVARRGCAGLAYTIVLVPVVLVIGFFSTIPRGWEQFADLVWKIRSDWRPFDLWNFVFSFIQGAVDLWGFWRSRRIFDDDGFSRRPARGPGHRVRHSLLDGAVGFPDA